MSQDTRTSLTQRHDFTGNRPKIDTNDSDSDCVPLTYTLAAQSRDVTDAILRYCAISDNGPAGCSLVYAKHELDHAIVTPEPDARQAAAERALVRLEATAELGDSHIRSLARDAAQLILPVADGDVPVDGGVR